MKKCRECRIEKPLSDFYVKRGGRSYYSYCRPCNNSRNKVGQRARYLRRQYDLSVAEANALLSKGCAVCGSVDRLVIDHCHHSGQVRAALCNSCNLALGHAQDDPGRLRALASYLEN